MGEGSYVAQQPERRVLSLWWGVMAVSSARPAPRKTIPHIAAEVADRHHLDVLSLVGRCNFLALVKARKQAMYLMVEAGFSSEQVAQYFGRDRSTVSYAHRSYSARGLAR